MKFKPLWALGLTMLAASTQAFGGATLDRIEQKKELVGVLMESYPPFSFLNDQNQLDGFDVDVAKAVAQKLGVKLRLETPSWDVIAAGRWSGRYDICICSMTPSKARAEVFDFPVEYYASPAVIVVNAKDDRIHGAKDLSGKKVGLTSASSYESYLNKNLVIEGAEDTQLQYPFEEVQIAPYDTEPCQRGPGIDIGRVVILVAHEFVAGLPGDAIGKETETQRGRPQQGNLGGVSADEARAKLPGPRDIAEDIPKFLMVPATCLHVGGHGVRSAARQRGHSGVAKKNLFRRDGKFPQPVRFVGEDHGVRPPVVFSPSMSFQNPFSRPRCSSSSSMGRLERKRKSRMVFLWRTRFTRMPSGCFSK